MHFEIKSRLKILIIVASAWLMCDAHLNEGDLFLYYYMDEKKNEIKIHAPIETGRSLRLPGFKFGRIVL